MNSPQRGNKLMLYLMFYKLFISFLLINTIILFNIQINLATLIILSQLLSFFIPFLLYKYVTKQSLAQILLLKPLSIKSIVLIVAMSILIQPSMMLVSAITSLFATNNVAVVMEHLTALPLALTILAIGVAPSLFEELMFRGAIYNEYKNVGIKKAALVNGLFFGMMHMNLQQFFYAAFLGIILTYFIHYTGSILAPILSHFVINTSQVILAYISFNSMSYMYIEDMPEPNMLLATIYMAIFALLLTPLFIFLFKELIDDNKGNYANLHIQKEGVDLTLESGLSSYKINTWAFKGVIIYFVLYFVIDYLW